MIEINGLSKSFGDNVVLDDVSFTVREGGTLALFGPSGTGKSVLLKHIIGLIEPDEGDVVVDGVSITNANRRQLNQVRQRVGYVFQGSALFDSLSVGENIQLGMDVDGCRLKKKECEERVAECLKLVNLHESVAGLYPIELSGGMQKRVAIARAFAGHQNYLLYDEPTTGLDPENAFIITNLIEHLSEELGVTSIMVTHDLDNAFLVADRIALLYEGKIRFKGPVEEFRESEDPIVRRFVSPSVETIHAA
ncbi:MAG: ATP-binding cassette domain-containing protein [Gemmatimonadota bacterium]|nr:MAG: ATP-binding cassette domain-containing protein [Gemmatimonadota bacterium]